MCRQTPRQHPPKPCPGQPGWARHTNEQLLPTVNIGISCFGTQSYFNIQNNCTQILLRCLWIITHKASWNKCHYFAFMFKKFFPRGWGLFSWPFFLLRSHYLPPTEINNSSLSHHMHSSASGNTPWFVGFSLSSHKMLHQFWQCKK